MTDRTSMSGYEYDVALSFAGEDRNYVEQIAQLLRSRGVRVFYDEFMTADMWGEDLYVLLDEIYRKKSRFTVVFASKNYVKKVWTSHERQSAQARALNEPGAYLLPVRLDDSEIPGIRPTVAYVDARKISPERLVDLIEQKLGKPLATSRKPLIGVPRSLEEKARLLAERPDAWEYLLFAGAIFMGKEALSSKIRDYELGYSPRIGPTLSDSEAMSFLSNEFGDAVAINANTMKIISPESQEWAFGRPVGAENLVRVRRPGDIR
jgi:TIR domain